jgi:hypothetical protein
VLPLASPRSDLSLAAPPDLAAARLGQPSLNRTSSGLASGSISLAAHRPNSPCGSALGALPALRVTDAAISPGDLVERGRGGSHRHRGEPVPGNADHIVDAPRDPEVAVLAFASAAAGDVHPWNVRPVSGPGSRRIAVKSPKHGRLRPLPHQEAPRRWAAPVLPRASRTADHSGSGGVADPAWLTSRRAVRPGLIGGGGHRLVPPGIGPAEHALRRAGRAVSRYVLDGRAGESGSGASGFRFPLLPRRYEPRCVITRRAGEPWTRSALAEQPPEITVCGAAVGAPAGIAMGGARAHAHRDRHPNAGPIEHSKPIVLPGDLPPRNL